VILVLQHSATEEQLAEILEEVEHAGLQGRLLRSDDTPLIHIVSGPTRRARRLLRLEQVQALLPTSGPRVRRFGRRFYPYHFIRWCAACIALLGLLVFFAGYLPPGTGVEIDTRGAPAGLAMTWYAEGTLAILDTFSPERTWVGWLLLLGASALVFLLPVIDRTKGERRVERWVVLGASVAFVAAVTYFAMGGPK